MQATIAAPGGWASLSLPLGLALAVGLLSVVASATLAIAPAVFVALLLMQLLLMLLAGQLLLESADSPGHCQLVPGGLRLDGELIAEVITDRMPRPYQLGGPECLITPGFIDTHLHLPQFEIIGAHGLPLLTWLDEVTFPAEMKWQDVEEARVLAARAFDLVARASRP